MSLSGIDELCPPSPVPFPEADEEVSWGPGAGHRDTAGWIAWLFLQVFCPWRWRIELSEAKNNGIVSGNPLFIAVDGELVPECASWCSYPAPGHGGKCKPPRVRPTPTPPPRGGTGGSFRTTAGVPPMPRPAPPARVPLNWAGGSLQAPPPPPSRTDTGRRV